ncbi:MAG: hypothetical protein QOF02_3980 [Blastocatellia bacterium]|jgi:hypothetical protein|nr:hypothetical protein [Blastocatellia bacterium]
MKALTSALFIVALAVVSAAQSQVASTNPPDIAISKASWSRSYIKPDFNDSSFFSAETGSGLFDGNNNSVTVIRARVSSTTPLPTTHEVPARKKDPYKIDSYKPAAAPFANGYRYQATLRNTGTRTIKALEWEYVFTDTIDQNIVTRHRFRTRTKIAPGKEKNLNELSKAAPTSVINARAVEKNPSQPFTEQVIITRILYTDGSVWERPVK